MRERERERERERKGELKWRSTSLFYSRSFQFEVRFTFLLPLVSPQYRFIGKERGEEERRRRKERVCVCQREERRERAETKRYSNFSIVSHVVLCPNRFVSLCVCLMFVCWTYLFANLSLTRTLSLHFLSFPLITFENSFRFFNISHVLSLSHTISPSNFLTFTHARTHTLSHARSYLSRLPLSLCVFLSLPAHIHVHIWFLKDHFSG